MFHTQAATSLAPALVVYLIDASYSMNDPCGRTTKIDLVHKALQDAVQDMVRRSMSNGVIQPRYKVAIFAYSTKVLNLLDGFCDLADLVKYGLPTVSADGETDTEAGFSAVETLFQKELPEFQASPAPLVCHLTDALITMGNPAPVVQRIQAMTVDDGPVLVENVYLADQILHDQMANWMQWPGLLKPRQLKSAYARFLCRLSSPLPDSYRQNVNNYGYHLKKGAALFFPGTQTEMVRLAFAISTATHVK